MKRIKLLSGFRQELVKFAKFGDSLLTRSAKLQDLMADLESELVDKEVSAETAARAKKSIPY